MKNKLTPYSWLESLVEPAVYRFYEGKVDWRELGRITEETGPFDDENIEPVEEPADLNDRVQLAYSLNSANRTMLYDDAVRIWLTDA